MKKSYVFFISAFILFVASQFADDTIRRLFGYTICSICFCTSFILDEIEKPKP